MGRSPAEVANRAPLHLSRTLQLALAIADNEGIEAVTMRRLAREMGVEAASLYESTGYPFPGAEAWLVPGSSWTPSGSRPRGGCVSPRGCCVPVG